MAATQLGIYNAVLIELGDATLASLSEDREPRRILDALYTPLVEWCLQSGEWNFATRTIKIDADPSITPAFGFQYVFAKPSDWLRTQAVSGDEYFSAPLLRYVDDVTYWSADQDPLYVRYTSNDASWGLNLATWPVSYTRFVELALALRYCERSTQNASKGEILRERLKEAKREAIARDAMNQAQPRFRPPGSWSQSRFSGFGTRGYNGLTS